MLDFAGGVASGRWCSAGRRCEHPCAAAGHDDGSGSPSHDDDNGTSTDDDGNDAPTYDDDNDAPAHDDDPSAHHDGNDAPAHHDDNHAATVHRDWVRRGHILHPRPAQRGPAGSGGRSPVHA